MHRVAMIALACLLGLASDFAWLPINVTAGGNGIQSPAPDAVVRGTIKVLGTANDQQFAKWQLDLLPASAADQATFLALGEQPQASIGDLAVLDTTYFADGDYSLRLRVVRSDGNYDEFFRQIAIANHVASSPQPSRPAASAPVRPTALSKAARLGLSTRSDDGAPILYLTFDDGPNPVFTPQIVNILARYDAKATFFVIGAHLDRSPAALLSVAEGGHTIANHTWSHKSLVGVGEAGVASQLTRTADLVQTTVGDALPPGSKMRWLRPPYGALDAEVASLVEKQGYQVVTWDIDPKDWQRPGATAIANAVINRAFPGAVVVLHDGGGGSQQTVTALETILGTLSEHGYEFHALP